ncbi:class I glutamine amidotransferase-like protein [Epithele typhae]|uniref:class I glutamine amidotransferase-like protein n=1 Tax=Epithele typhae TaxID=378194 RepID=UPI0020087985|nr:class I glutamine amidotransferase-like protein [Epithele typhae]KAH9904231.1 class I glutamine amidotransferase-like protein [Epithele typhae]
MVKRILFVLSSADRTLTGSQTGWYLPEAAHPYYVLAPKYEIDFAAPKGPNPPVDESSVEGYPDDRGFLTDPAVAKLLSTAKLLSEVSAANYDAIFYVGGQGPVLDLATDPVNAKLASDFFNSGKITAAVCHGPVAFDMATTPGGEPIVKGKRLTCFTNDEETDMGTAKNLPFLVEDKLVSLGAIFEKTKVWGVKVVVDGTLITGQNPASAKAVGEAIDQALSA